MKLESRLHHAPQLGHDMEYRVYGSGGQPVVAFPSMGGRFYDFEGFGMIDALGRLLEEGRLTLYAVDGVDWQSWTNHQAPVEERARRHQDYDRYLAETFLPLVLEETGRQATWLTGCSMGAYHAANAFFRHPDLADGLIAISGLYQPSMFVGSHTDEAVYFNAPLYYLPDMNDEQYLDRYRRSTIVFCIGQGRWEEECLADHRAMERILAAKQIPATFDYWGHDVDHDWPWWRRMRPYWLERLGV